MVEFRAPETGDPVNAARVPRSGLRFYRAAAVLLAAWTVGVVAISTFVPDLYFYSYYSVDYSLGFIRRGLAGELLGIFPSSDYFTGLKVLRWVPTVVYAVALAAVAWTVGTRFGSSERRLMLALFVPVMPFGVVFALFSARPDLIGGAALAFLAVFLAPSRSDRTVLAASSAYGLFAVPMTLMHEATPFLYSLGAVAAIAVFARHCARSTQQLSAVLALAPGLVAGFAVAVFGLRGVSTQLCALVPYGQVDNALAGRPTIGELLRGFEYSVDYHDWLCSFILPYFDQGFGDASQFIASRGAVPLLLSVLLGVFIFAVTMLAISHISSVPLRHFWQLLRRHVWWIAAGLALLIPVFLTGVDWTRWWVTISFDVGLVYLLYAGSQPEAALAATPRTRRVFAGGAALLAIMPIGMVPGFAGVVPW